MVSTRNQIKSGSPHVLQLLANKAIKLTCADEGCEEFNGAAGEACEPGGESTCDDIADGQTDCDDTDCVNAAPCQPSEDGGNLPLINRMSCKLVGFVQHSNLNRA